MAVATVSIRFTRRQHAELASRKLAATVGRWAIVAGAWLMDRAYPGSIETKVEFQSNPEQRGT